MRLEAEVRHFIDRQRVARFATHHSGGGAPHLVPVVCVRVDDCCYMAIDEKPKRTTRLQRLRNLEADPHSTLLFDEYEEDWSQLAWVMLRGTAAVVEETEEREQALAALRSKYPQYRPMALDGPVLRFTPDHILSWAS